MSESTTPVALMTVLVLTACGSSEAEPQALSPPAQVEPTMEEQQEAQRAAEERARAAFFEFELTDVDDIHGGDWVAFYEHKVAADRALAPGWHWNPQTPLGQRTPEEARARHALQLEHQRVVIPEINAAREVAKGVAAALLAGDVTSVAQDCVMYGSTPEGVAASEARLREQLPAIQRALRSMDQAAEDYGGSVGVSAAMPDHGMQASATVGFGPDAEAPEDDNPNDPLYPATHQMILYWSGPVMPDSSGPRYSAPQPGLPTRGRWRFSRFVFPYAQRRGALQ
ncbi:MAG: hypothetical protein DRJ42_22000 [Deltaproteobacteria bacterium]|nr:MAG: hypothetical protein DRJ42_22000 [Deltaproteobacteria bacterium]